MIRTHSKKHNYKSSIVLS